MAVDLTTPILIVDDYKAMVRIIRNLLHQLGFAQIDEAHDGEAALAKLRERTFGLVISDWNMEPMSGPRAPGAGARHARSLQDLPFIMVTAENRPTTALAKAREAGVSGYVVKPFNADTLSRQIASVIGG